MGGRPPWRQQKMDFNAWQASRQGFFHWSTCFAEVPDFHGLLLFSLLSEAIFLLSCNFAIICAACLFCGSALVCGLARVRPILTHLLQKRGERTKEGLALGRLFSVCIDANSSLPSAWLPFFWETKAGSEKERGADAHSARRACAAHVHMIDKKGKCRLKIAPITQGAVRGGDQDKNTHGMPRSQR